MAIKLNAATGGGSVALDAPNSTDSNADVVLTLPTNDGDSGQYLQTNGTGTLSWDTVTTGKILQVVELSDNTSRSTTNNTYITAVSGSITPVAADSDILIISNISGFYSSGDDTFSTVRISGTNFTASTTALNTNNTQTAQSNSYAVNHLHSPTYTLGNSVTYTLEANNGRNNNTSTVYLNNGSTSVMLLLEVAA